MWLHDPIPNIHVNRDWTTCSKDDNYSKCKSQYNLCVCVCVEGGEELYDYLVFVEIFTLITKKIFI